MQTEAMGSERRAFPRKAFTAETELIAPSGTQRVEVLDLSMGGARVRAPAAAGGWGDPVEVWLPGGRALEPVRATIVRVQAEGDAFVLGLRFEALSPGSRQTLAALVELPS